MRLQFKAAAYPQISQLPVSSSPHIGFTPNDAVLFSGRHTLLQDIQTGKVSGLKALRALQTHYPGLAYYGTATAGLNVVEPSRLIWYTASGEYIPDGPPSVIAHPDYRLSLFHALILNRIPKTHGYYFDNQSGSLVFRIDMNSREWAHFKRNNKSKSGSIYILNPDGMTVHRQVPTNRSSFRIEADQKLCEFRSEKPLTPLASIQITMQDFLEMLRKDRTLQLLDGKGKPLDLT
jgi:hypothetical protein